MNINYYIISLKENIKQIAELKEKNINVKLIKGIDGKKLNLKTINKNTSNFWSKFGPRSAIGCGLSHLKTWKKFLKSKSNYGVIFEDDIFFDKQLNLKEEIEKFISHTPKDFDILYTGTISENSICKYLPFKIKDGGKIINEYIKIPYLALGAHAYIISKKGAKKLINLLNNKIFHHIDFCMQYFAIKEKLKVYMSMPRIVFQTSTDKIHQSRNVSNIHPVLLNKILSNFYIDDHVRLNYFTSVSCFQYCGLIINIISILFLIFGIFFYKKNWISIHVLFVLISILETEFTINILFHYILFILPKLIL